MILRRSTRALHAYTAAAMKPNPDKERESFTIFDSLTSKKPPQSSVERLADRVLTLSLRELAELSRALNDPKIVGDKTIIDFPVQSEMQLPKNRSPFPHPKHLFSGVDADSRPGMHTIFIK